MSIERNFEKLVIEHNPEQKKASWQKIQKMLEEDEQETVADIEFGNTLAKSFFSNRRNLIIIVSSALVLLTAAILMLVFLLPEPLPPKRYCAMGDYYIVSSDISIKEYSEQNDLSLFYFEDSEYAVYEHYKLKDDDEIICLKEELSDEDGNYLSYYITDNNTEIDVFSEYSNICVNSIVVNSVNIEWGYYVSSTRVFFNYGNWNYYIDIQSIVDETSVENLLKTLIRV